MNKQQIKEAILGKDNCPKEETPLTQFATFHPDMERATCKQKQLKIIIPNATHDGGYEEYLQIIYR